MNRIRLLLSGKGIGILFTLISIAAINGWQQVLGNFDNDNSFSLAAAKNIYDGHGYSIKAASASDLSKFYYYPLNKWPPGYSFLLAALHGIVNKSWIQVAFILNFIGLTLLVLVFRKIFFQLEYPSWIVNAAVLYFGFLLLPFHFSNYADIFGLLFFLYGLSLLIAGIKAEEKILSMSVLAAVFLGAACYLKYLYLPLSFLPIISLFIQGYYRRKNNFQIAALKSGVVFILIVASLLLFQYSNSGQPLYINQSKTGFFPLQLLRMSPVIPYGLLNMQFINMQLSIRLNIPFPYLQFIWLIFFIGCVGWLFYFSYDFFRSRYYKVSNVKGFYAIQAVAFTLVLFAYLMVLTVLKNKHYPDSFSDWVYVEELRYYSIFIVFIIQFIVFLYLKKEYFFKRTGRIIFRVIVGIGLFLEISHASYYLIRTMGIEKKYGTKIPSDQYLYRSMDLAKTAFSKNQALVICTNNQPIANMCSLDNGPAFLNLASLTDSSISESPVTLLIAIDSRVPGGTVPHMPDLNIKPDYVAEHVKFYLVNLPKSKGF
jgi:hypothetical protein